MAPSPFRPPRARLEHAFKPLETASVSKEVALSFPHKLSTLRPQPVATLANPV